MSSWASPHRVNESDDALRAATGFTKAHWVANAETTEKQ
jgi:hypothetical protein